MPLATLRGIIIRAKKSARINELMTKVTWQQTLSFA